MGSRDKQRHNPERFANSLTLSGFVVITNGYPGFSRSNPGLKLANAFGVKARLRKMKIV
jgi:hypothetical protein